MGGFQTNKPGRAINCQKTKTKPKKIWISLMEESKMKKALLLALIAMMLISMLAFSACKKDTPAEEVTPAEDMAPATDAVPTDAVPTDAPATDAAAPATDAAAPAADAAAPAPVKTGN
jgi:flagellar basal body-associated protein FliL